MASTNKTTNIHLSQFVASDKPAWLTDYNNDMRAIDEAVAAKGVNTYIHSKSGTVHTLTGTGDNIKFVATAGYAVGDTFVVNGMECEAKTVSGEVLDDKCFAANTVITCVLSNNVLFFSLTKCEWINIPFTYAPGYANYDAAGTQSFIKYSPLTKQVVFRFYLTGTVPLGRTKFIVGIPIEYAPLGGGIGFPANTGNNGTPIWGSINKDTETTLKVDAFATVAGSYPSLTGSYLCAKAAE